MCSTWEATTQIILGRTLLLGGFQWETLLYNYRYNTVCAIHKPACAIHTEKHTYVHVPLEVPEADWTVSGAGGQSEGGGSEGDGRLRVERDGTSSLVVTWLKDQQTHMKNRAEENASQV